MSISSIGGSSPFASSPLAQPAAAQPPAPPDADGDHDGTKAAASASNGPKGSSQVNILA